MTSVSGKSVVVRYLTMFRMGTDDLRNRYALVTISTARHAHVDGERADRLATWMLSPETAKRIEEFRVGGQSLFHPDAAAVPAGR